MNIYVGLILTIDLEAELTMGRWVMCHGSNGQSLFSDRSMGHGSEPLTH